MAQTTISPTPFGGVTTDSSLSGKGTSSAPLKVGDISNNVNSEVQDYTSTSSFTSTINDIIRQYLQDNPPSIDIDSVYPVGAIYMSVNSTDPGSLFPGTYWESWGEGRVPVGVMQSGGMGPENGWGPLSAELESGSGNADAGNLWTMLTFDSSGVIGVNGKTVSESWTVSGRVEGLSMNWRSSQTNNAIGVGGFVDTYQPSISVYMWKRTS